jgi:hypothetical protein
MVQVSINSNLTCMILKGKRNIGLAIKLKLLTGYSLEDSVKKDVKFLKECPFIRKDITIRGFTFDLKTNVLAELK